MIALAVVMIHVLAHRPPKVAFPNRNDLRQALRLDRSNEPLRVGVQIRAPARKPQGADAGAAQDLSEALREERIAVMNEIAALEQESVFAVWPVSSDLPHPRSVG